MKTYEFEGYLVTTDEELTGFIRCWEVTIEQAEIIEDGNCNISIIEDDLVIKTEEEEIIIE